MAASPHGDPNLETEAQEDCVCCQIFYDTNRCLTHFCEKKLQRLRG
jgi:hypothetical protein